MVLYLASAMLSFLRQWLLNPLHARHLYAPKLGSEQSYSDQPVAPYDLDEQKRQELPPKTTAKEDSAPDQKPFPSSA